MDSPLLTALDRQGTLVLDGAMATELERHGADLSGGLWSARVLLDQPSLVGRVHRAYFDAGADVAITASYQASVGGFAKLGIDRRAAERLMQRSVELAVSARDEFWTAELARDPSSTRGRSRPLVATSVGPYGAVLADGSEYTGDYDISYAELVSFHRERLEVLTAAGAEVLACETVPSLTEARALVEAISAWPELTVWVSFSARSDREVSDGTPLSACAAFLREQDQVVAIGVNCTAVEHISPLIRELSDASDKPIMVYPNSGEVYDAHRKVWVGAACAVDFGALAREWYGLGARLIGGCCRTGPAQISAIAEALRGDAQPVRTPPPDAERTAPPAAKPRRR